MDRKDFKTAINVSWSCNPAVKSGEQVKTLTIFSWSSPVKFGASIPICKIASCLVVVYPSAGINSETSKCSKLRDYLLPGTATDKQSKRLLSRFISPKIFHYMDGNCQLGKET